MFISACCDVLEDTRMAKNIQEAIEMCYRLGFDAVELSLPHVLHSQVHPQQVGRHCRDFGLAVCGLHNSLPNDFTIFNEQGHVRPAFPDHLRRALDVATQVGAPVVTIGIGPSRWIPPPYHRDWAADRFIQALQRIDEEMTGQDIILSIEVISSRTAGFFNSAQEILYWIEQSSLTWLGLTCDTFQSLQENLGPVSEIKIALPYLANLHLAEESRRPPGQGTIDFVELFYTLTQAGYTRGASIELKPPSSTYWGTLQPLYDLEAGLKYVRGCLQKLSEQKGAVDLQ